MSAGEEPLGKELGTGAHSSWREQALCQYVGADVFFPDPGQSVQVRAAKRICALCPVTEQCLASALSLETPYDAHGVWGGLTASERHPRASAQQKFCHRGHAIEGHNALRYNSRGRQLFRCRTCKEHGDRASLVRNRKCSHRPFEPGFGCRECASEAGKRGMAKRWSA